VDFRDVAALTFDCYGTLIDWESGILGVLRPILRRHGVEAADEAVLERFGRLESRLEGGPYQPYRSILAGVVRGFGAELGFSPTAAEVDALAASLGDWPPFADTTAALAALAGRFKLGIISNVDDDLFAQTARRLQVPFEWVTTAQQARAYKPSTAPFELALERIGAAGIGPERVVHVAQSLFHDHVPAHQLGLSSVWVDRRHDRPGGGATPPPGVAPDVQLTVPSLAVLAELALRS
jgi:2-haloacid dehalogenase